MYLLLILPQGSTEHDRKGSLSFGRSSADWAGGYTWPRHSIDAQTYQNVFVLSFVSRISFFNPFATASDNARWGRDAALRSEEYDAWKLECNNFGASDNVYTRAMHVESTSKKSLTLI